MAIHELKCWPMQFKELIDGTKTFELRKDDRDYAVGDQLLLREYIPSVDEITFAPIANQGQYTNREATFDIIGGARGGEGLYRSVQAGYVILSVRKVA